MKQYIALTAFLGLIFTSVFAAAETATLTIEGMHCGACKKMITKKVCGDAVLAAQFESCEFAAFDAKKQIGTLVIKYKPNVKADLVLVETNIQAAGDYKITKKEIK